MPGPGESRWKRNAEPQLATAARKGGCLEDLRDWLRDWLPDRIFRVGPSITTYYLLDLGPPYSVGSGPSPSLPSP